MQNVVLPLPAAPMARTPNLDIVVVVEGRGEGSRAEENVRSVRT